MLDSSPYILYIALTWKEQQCLSRAHDNGVWLLLFPVAFRCLLKVSINSSVPSVSSVTLCIEGSEWQHKPRNIQLPGTWSDWVRRLAGSGVQQGSFLGGLEAQRKVRDGRLTGRRRYSRGAEDAPGGGLDRRVLYDGYWSVSLVVSPVHIVGCFIPTS